jgi:hypothetical protein
MPNAYFGMQHMNNNLMCSIQIRTSGPNPGEHEILQLAVMPLNRFLKVHDDIPIFDMKFKMEYPGNLDQDYCRLTNTALAECAVRGVDKYKMVEIFDYWYREIKLPFRKKILPLGYDWGSIKPFLVEWLGQALYDDIFASEYRDVLQCALFMNDRAGVRCDKITFPKTDFGYLCSCARIEHIDKGAPLSDCEAVAQLYDHLLRLGPLFT